MKKAIYMVVNDDVDKTMLTIKSSVEVNTCNHYVFYDSNQIEIGDYAKVENSRIKFIDLNEVIDVKFYHVMAKYVEVSHHHPAVLFVINTLAEYDYIIYLSQKVFVVSEFDCDEYINDEVFIAPPLAAPFDDRFVTNQFINKYHINQRVYLSEDMLIIKPKLFIEQEILKKFEKFVEDLYYQTKIDVNSNKIIRIPTLLTFNLFVGQGIKNRYLAQRFLLNIEYTIDYSGEMAAFYLDESLDYGRRLDEQANFKEIDYTENIYHLEYLLYILKFCLEKQIYPKEVLDFNIAYVKEQIIERNGIYQERLGQ